MGWRWVDGHAGIPVLANIIVALKDSVGAWVTGGGNLKKAVWACCRLELRA